MVRLAAPLGHLLWINIHHILPHIHCAGEGIYPVIVLQDAPLPRQTDQLVHEHLVFCDGCIDHQAVLVHYWLKNVDYP